MLFSDRTARRLDLENADVVYVERFFDNHDSLFTELRDTTPWVQKSLTFGNRQVPQPRLISWHGAADAVYTYSGLRLPPNPMTPALDKIASALDERLPDLIGREAEFNSVLLNFYRHGRDSIGDHSDNEPELGRQPTIASLSFGGERVFTFTRKNNPAEKVNLRLASGSLLLMAGDTQRHWLHGIAKTKEPVDPRINATFRLVRH